MKYTYIGDSGKTLSIAMKILMRELLREVDSYSELETADFKLVDIERIRNFLKDKVELILPYLERKIKFYVNLTFKRGVEASISTEKNLFPSDVKLIRNIQGYWVNAFKSLTDEMKSKVTRIVNDGLRSNVPPTTIKTRLRNLFEVDKKAKKSGLSEEKGVRLINRAEMIGRTLIVEGYNSARVDRDRRSGIVWGHKWRTSSDEKVCPICNGLDGQVREMEGYFKISHKNKTYQVRHPPVHIHCRCRAQAVTFSEAKRNGYI